MTLAFRPFTMCLRPLATIVFAGLVCTLASVRGAERPYAPRVAIIALFEAGADSGDRPGELQFWVEREHLDRVIPLPAAFHDVRMNADGTVIAIAAGVGNTNAAASIMALGLDPRFDFRRTYWLVAGIAGIDPADASIGSAVWADFVVDGDLAHEIDARELPPGWDTGYVPLGKTKPYETPLDVTSPRADQVYELNPALLHWAFALTKDVPLEENEKLAKIRARYTAWPNAQRPAFVLIGSNLAASTYWHGEILNRWANEWTRYYTQGRGNFVTTAMEDSGVLRALENLTRAGKADRNRALVLRTASNFDLPPPGKSAAASLAGDTIDGYSAYLPSLEAAHRVGSRVVHALVDGWKEFEKTPPSAPAP